MKKFLFILVLVLFLVVNLSSQNRIVALTVIIKDKTPQEIIQIKAEFEKVALKYSLQVSEIPLGDLIEKKMKSLK